MKVFRL